MQLILLIVMKNMKSLLQNEPIVQCVIMRAAISNQSSLSQMKMYLHNNSELLPLVLL